MTIKELCEQYQTCDNCPFCDACDFFTDSPDRLYTKQAKSVTMSIIRTANMLLENEKYPKKIILNSIYGETNSVYADTDSIKVREDENE